MTDSGLSDTRRVQVEDAISALADAEARLANASTLLSTHGGKATEKQWWFDVNKLYDDAHTLGERLGEALQ
jgi:hypothetical protein